MSCSISLHPDNSILFSVTLTNQSVAVNDATVSVTIYDSSDVEVTGQTWPLVLPYVAASSGEYEETTNPISGITANQTYKIVTSVVGADSLEGSWTTYSKATIRECA